MWDVLGIEPTNDERAIKRAYAKLLKKNRPDKDPVAFQELRDAYEWCLRATKWADYDDVDDQETADNDAAAETDGTESVDVADDATDAKDRSSIFINDDEGVPEAERDPVLSPDGPVDRIVASDADAVATTSSALPVLSIVNDSRLDGSDSLGGGMEGRAPDGANSNAGKTPVLQNGAVDDAAVEDSPNPLEMLVIEFQHLLADGERAQQSQPWQAWFATADKFSLHQRQGLRSVIVDLMAIAWHHDPERTKHILKMLPYPAVTGLSDLLGWPHSQIEMSEHIPDDLVLLLGDVLEFDMITEMDRAAFFGLSDPEMVAVPSRSDNRRHRNGLLLGPFWCLYRRQFRRMMLVAGVPIIVSFISAILRVAEIPVLSLLGLLVMFACYKAGDVRIRWIFACCAAVFAMIFAVGSAAIVPAIYIMLAVPLHIEGWFRGYQWREEQLKDALKAMPMNIRSDPDYRHDYLSTAGAPSKWAPLWGTAAAIGVMLVQLVVVGVLSRILAG